MKKNCIALAIAALCITAANANDISSLLRASLPVDRPYIEAKTPVKGKAGFYLYRITLNPFVIEEYRKSPDGVELERRQDKQYPQNTGVIIAAREIQKNII